MTEEETASEPRMWAEQKPALCRWKQVRQLDTRLSFWMARGILHPVTTVLVRDRGQKSPREDVARSPGTPGRGRTVPPCSPRREHAHDTLVSDCRTWDCGRTRLSSFRAPGLRSFVLAVMVH